MSETTKITGSAVNDASAGKAAWSNPSNAETDDSNFAQCALTNPSPQSNYLKATSFGFAIPADATMNGIGMSYKRSSTSGRGSDLTIKLVVGGSVSGDNKASGSWPATAAETTKGGSADLWGVTLTPAQVNASNFGGVIQAQKSLLCYGQVYYVKMTAYYTPAGGGSIIPQVRYFQNMRNQ